MWDSPISPRLQKTCRSPLALQYALAALPIFHKVSVVATAEGPTVVNTTDVQTVLRCDLCDYSCDTAKQLGMHSRITHSSRHPVNKCIDVSWCTVCGIDRHNRAGMMVHLQDRSHVCRLNLLLRGEFVSDEAAAALDDEAAASRLKNVHSGRGKHFVDKTCVRVFGPWPIVVNLAGEVISSLNGHPLGNSQKWYKPARLDPRLLLEIGCASHCKRFSAWVRGKLSCRCQLCTARPAHIVCPASLFVVCTGKCVLCGGVPLLPARAA